MASQTKMETIDINNISGNYDVEAAVVQAEPSNNDNNNEDEDEDEYNNTGGGCCTTPILHSPLRYYFKFLICIVSIVKVALSLVKYNGVDTNGEDFCPRDESFMLGNVFFCLLGLLWGIQGLVHLLFIIVRFIKKEKVTNELYAGPFEKKMAMPLTIDLILVVICCIWGLIMAFTSVLRDPCGGKMKDDIAHDSILYLVLCLLFAKRLFCRGN